MQARSARGLWVHVPGRSKGVQNTQNHSEMLICVFPLQGLQRPLYEKFLLITYGTLQSGGYSGGPIFRGIQTYFKGSV